MEMGGQCLELAGNGAQTGNDIYQLVGNGGLATSVVFHGQRANHIRGVLRCIVHRIATVRDRSIGRQCCKCESVPRALFASMALDKGSIESVGKREFEQVPCGVLLVLISLETA